METIAITSVVQRVMSGKDNHPYGTNVPLWLAKEELRRMVDPEGRFLLVMGDDVLHHSSGASAVAGLIATARAKQATSAMLATSVDRSLAHNYGLVMTDIDGNFTRIRERPQGNDIPPHPLANLSKYILELDILNDVEKVQAGAPAANGEFQIIAAVNNKTNRGGDMLVVTTDSLVVPGAPFRYLDGGDPAGIAQIDALTQGLIVTEANPHPRWNWTPAA